MCVKTKREHELKLTACKLSLQELNTLVDECMDNGEFDDASIYAKIYTRRVGSTSQEK